MKIVALRMYKGKALPSFDCGQDELNDIYYRYASQNDRKGFGRTYLAFEGDELVGFFTLAAAEITCDELRKAMKKGLPRYPVPAYRVARFAVAKEKQGKGYGGEMLKNAIFRILEASFNAGIHLVVVDAKPSAAWFYEHYGFIRLQEDRNIYALPLATVMKCLGQGL